MTELLAPSLLAALERLQLRNTTRLVGSISGGHRSRRFGSSLDFADYREYQPGDDLRRIDLFAAARLDRLLIRLFEAEDDIVVRILLDTSASMAGPKIERARQVAGAIGFLALRNRDVVELHTITSENQQQFTGRRFAGPSALPALFRELTGLTSGGTTPFATAVKHLLEKGGTPGLTVVVSDLFTSEWEAGIRRLPVRGSELMVLHIIDPTDYRPTIYGDLELVDRETGERLEVSISAKVIADYAARAEAWREQLASRVRAVGGTYVCCDQTQPLDDFLFGKLLATGAMK